VTTRLLSLVALICLWQVAAHFGNPRLLPGPMAVFTTMRSEAASGALFTALGVTLARVVAAFFLAMAAGSAIGYAMARNALVDRVVDPWVIVLLNLPALVIIVLAYIWVGLNEAAAIGAVALNKLPVTVVTIREGVRTLDARLDEMARVFGFSPLKRLAHVVAPQLAPYFAAAARAGLSLVWKIVLVVELMGRPNGVGFEINTAFQLFDVPLLLAYALPFTAIMLIIETLMVQPFERHVSRWRPRAAA
jgi:NitT/TauT family transport system permease protein